MRAGVVGQAQGGGEAVPLSRVFLTESPDLVAVGRPAAGRGRGPSAVDSTPPGRPQNIPIQASKGLTCPNLREIGSGRGRGFSLVVFPTPLLLV